MSEPAVVCLAKESLQQAVERMRDANVGMLAVVSEEGRIHATVTDRDICLTAADVRRPLDEILVDAARSATALTCDLDDPIETAHSIMQVNSVRRLVVVDAQARPVGMLSIDDLAVEALRELERHDTLPAITPEQLVRTLGEIARSVGHGHIPIPEGSEALPRPVE